MIKEIYKQFWPIWDGLVGAAVAAGIVLIGFTLTDWQFWAILIPIAFVYGYLTRKYI